MEFDIRWDKSPCTCTEALLLLWLISWKLESALDRINFEVFIDIFIILLHYNYIPGRS
jgi:hypothetical protein